MSKEQIKELAEDNAIFEFNKFKKIYGDCADEYIRHFYNKLAELRSGIDDVHTCSCQHNSNPRDSEPCCRCDSRKENREMKIVTVSDLIKILDTKENRYGATGKPRMLNLSLNDNFAGSIETVKLDGYGDGLITDVTLEITSSKFTTTNADKIRNMSDEELAEFLTTFKNTFGEEYEGEASCVEWLKSEAEETAIDMEKLDVRR